MYPDRWCYTGRADGDGGLSLASCRCESAGGEVLGVLWMRTPCADARGWEAHYLLGARYGARAKQKFVARYWRRRGQGLGIHGFGGGLKV